MATSCPKSLHGKGERGKIVLHGTRILFEEPNPTGSRPRDLIGLYKQQRKPHPPNTQERARGKQPRKEKRPKRRKGEPTEIPREGTKRKQPRKPGRGRMKRRTQAVRVWHGNFVRRTQPHRGLPTRPNWALEATNETPPFVFCIIKIQMMFTDTISARD